MGNGLENFVSKVVDTGGNFLSAGGKVAETAGNFVAKMVQDDVKDAIKTARMVGVPSGPTADVTSKLMGESFKALGWHDLARETDPGNLSTSEKIGAGVNTVINAAALVPGLGAGVKAVQMGAKGSKLMKGGAKLTSQGLKKTVNADVSEKKLIDVFSKLAEDVTPTSVKGKFKDAVADESLKYLKEAKKGVHNLLDKPALKHIVQQQRLAKTGHGSLSLSEKLPKSVQQSLKAAWDDIGNLRDLGNFLSHAGKVTLNKGIRTSLDAAKYGFKAGKKQFVTQAANTWRKTPRSDSDTNETPKSAGKLGVGPIAKTTGLGKYHIVNDERIDSIKDKYPPLGRPARKKKKRKQY